MQNFITPYKTIKNKGNLIEEFEFPKKLTFLDFLFFFDKTFLDFFNYPTQTHSKNHL